MAEKKVFHPVLCLRLTVLLQEESSFLGAFTQSRKAPVSFVMFVHLSIRPSISACMLARIGAASTGRISLKFDTDVFYENLSRTSKFG